MSSNPSWTFRQRLVAPALILAVVLCAWAQVLRHDFVYDDHGVILENGFLQETNAWSRVLRGDTLQDAQVIDGRRPVVLLSYLMDNTCWGTDPLGWHLSNLFLHAVTTLLLFVLVVRLGRDLKLSAPGLTSLSIALLYALHPVHLESVAVPAFREDVWVNLWLFAALGVSSGLCSASRFRRWGTLVLILVLQALALLSKEHAVIWPFVFGALWIMVPAWRPDRRLGLVAFGLSLLLSALAFALWTTAPMQASGQLWNGLSCRGMEAVYTAPWQWVRILRWWIWPAPVVADYAPNPVRVWSDPRFAAGVASVCASLGGVLVLLKKQQRLAALGLLWMLIAWVPVSNLWPLLNPWAPRYAGFAVAGGAIFLAALADTFTRSGRPVRALLMAGLCSLYLALLIYQLSWWRNDKQLWSATLRSCPDSSRALTWTALQRAREQRYDEALVLYKQAYRLNPQDTSPLVGAALLQGRSGHIDLALQGLWAARHLRPDAPGVLFNLAVALDRSGHHEAASDLVREVAARHPGYIPAQVYVENNFSPEALDKMGSSGSMNP